MNKKTTVLHIGSKDWRVELEQESTEALEWTFLELGHLTETALDHFTEKRKHRPFDVVLCTDQWEPSVMKRLAPLIESYGVIIDQALQEEVPELFQKVKCPFFMALGEPEAIVQEIQECFFSGQFGSKLHTQSLLVNEQFEGEFHLSGEAFVELEGNFSKPAEQPLLTWQHYMWMTGRTKKLWLEFFHDPQVELSLQIIKIVENSSEVAEVSRYSASELRAGIEVPYRDRVGYLSLSLYVKGEGRLTVGPFHYRDSRGTYGEYLLGGQKLSDSQNQELFYYFHPGDLKPPLNVYFSGYRSAEGFEGFFLMKALKAPFLLITDPRLEGGCFYMGSTPLELGVTRVIKETLKKLGFGPQELILSGLSMGTFGALYYASDLEPGYVVIGKPLVNVGDIAQNEPLIRPGGFGTSLDILNFLTGGEGPPEVKQLNERFWRKFDRGKFKDTTFVVAYMKNDDYDVKAYPDLIEHLSEREAVVISKGIAGRHNDNSGGIIEWFSGQYRRLLTEYFNRRDQR